LKEGLDVVTHDPSHETVWWWIISAVPDGNTKYISGALTTDIDAAHVEHVHTNFNAHIALHVQQWQ
jgi:hypothetical protein